MRTRALGSLGLLSLLFLGVACGKGGSGGNASEPATVTDPNAPLITNLRASFGESCTLPNQNRGTIENLSFDYADANGNLRGRGGGQPDHGDDRGLSHVLDAPSVTKIPSRPASPSAATPASARRCA